jgi:hypothetical protein
VAHRRQISQITQIVKKIMKHGGFTYFKDIKDVQLISKMKNKELW